MLYVYTQPIYTRPHALTLIYSQYIVVAHGISSIAHYRQVGALSRSFCIGLCNWGKQQRP